MSMLYFFIIHPQFIRKGSICYHVFGPILEFGRSTTSPLYLSMLFQIARNQRYFAEKGIGRKFIRNGTIFYHDPSAESRVDRRMSVYSSRALKAENHRFFAEFEMARFLGIVPLKPVSETGRGTRCRGGICHAGVIPRNNYLPSSFSLLYCAVLIPITAPIKTAIADKVPTISSASGRFHIFESAKYNVPQAGSRIVHKNFRQS